MVSTGRDPNGWKCVGSNVRLPTFVATRVDSQYLTKKGGWIKVLETFQVVNCTKLFAFGDCCNLLPNAGISSVERHACDRT
jgi:hypothetical protein